MKYIAFILMIAAAISCESPTEPPYISHCSGVSSLLEGSWVRLQTRGDHTYRVDVELSNEAPCVFGYLSVATITEHEEVHQEAAGTVVLTHVEEFAGVYSFQVDTKMMYRSIRQPDGTMTESVDHFIYDQGPGKVWGDTLILWGRQFNMLTE